MEKFWDVMLKKLRFNSMQVTSSSTTFRKSPKSDVVVSGVIDNKESIPAKFASEGNTANKILALQLKVERETR